ncbi:NADH-quinone oxidoreductase subunit C [Paenibacillus sp. YYML68]|uniref:NADH-quinone oxidoreductase subunit C n=1 Tax=Paenibacillus sp. YYML68 TaxID=2909250 RepID=UPI0024917F30|nr:NADH-quinone oxidoreductase subunit C [Paenibacillus sp. YYML68]
MSDEEKRNEAEGNLKSENNVQQEEKASSTDEEKEAKAKAAAEARAARARERAAKTEEPTAPEVPKEPSPNQPMLDRLVTLVQELQLDAIEEASINERGGHLPTITVKGYMWPEIALMLRDHPELELNYLRNVSGVDMETHLEVVYHLISLTSKREYAVKVKTDRTSPSVPSITPVWATANWNEREIYDLLGIDFPGHPDLRRIMMPDDWIGHPLRKDYEPFDPEV